MLLLSGVNVAATEFYFTEKISADETYRLTRTVEDTGKAIFEQFLPGNPDFGVSTRSLTYVHSFEDIYPPLVPDGQLQYVRLKIFIRVPGNSDFVATVDSLDMENPHQRYFLIDPKGSDSLSVEDWPLDDGKVEIVLESSTKDFIVNGSDFDILYIPANPTDVADEWSQVPSDYELKANHPNPFNPSTAIGFFVPIRSHVEIRVYNLFGRKVRTLMDWECAPGRHSVIWDGCDDNGKPVASGVYFYRIKTQRFTSARKMILLK